MPYKIYRGSIDPDDLKKLLRLLRDAGVEVELLDGLPDQHCPPDAQIIVVLYPEGHSYHDAMNALMGAGARGCRITGVWPDSDTEQVTPRRFGDLGRGGTAPWEADQLRRVLTADSPTWLRPDGTERSEPDEEHLNCNQP